MPIGRGNPAVPQLQPGHDEAAQLLVNGLSFLGPDVGQDLGG
ncbi:hypothetical protein ACFWF7_14025 [Nocardia sp. NPDC060256]